MSLKIQYDEFLRESAMTRKTISFRMALRLLLLLMILMAANSLFAVSPVAQTGQAASAADSGQDSAFDVTGTWSGKFVSKDESLPPFTITVVINADSQGNLVGKSTLTSRCVKHAQLKVKVEGSKVELAGSDAQGDNLTLRGTLDDTGTILNSSYILDGSATGKCEPEGGKGTLTRQ